MKNGGEIPRRANEYCSSFFRRACSKTASMFSALSALPL